MVYVDGKHDMWSCLDDLRWSDFLQPGDTVLVHDAFSSLGVTLAVLRDAATTPPAPLRRAAPARWPASRSAGPRCADRVRVLRELPWFARNLVVKVLLRLPARPLARAAGAHRHGRPLLSRGRFVSRPRIRRRDGAGSSVRTSRSFDGSAVAVATSVMNVATYGFTILAARIIGPSQYGAFVACLSLLIVIQVVALGLQATAARRIAVDHGNVATIEQAILALDRQGRPRRRARLCPR